ncbi:hypothetical protein HaLaN_17800, partial [Haematococcus lacustris]
MPAQPMAYTFQLLIVDRSSAMNFATCVTTHAIIWSTKRALGLDREDERHPSSPWLDHLELTSFASSTLHHHSERGDGPTSQ